LSTCYAAFFGYHSLLGITKHVFNWKKEIEMEDFAVKLVQMLGAYNN